MILACMRAHERFSTALLRASVPEDRVEQLWTEVVSAYAAKGRHYHTVDHLETLHGALEAHWSALEDPEAMIFALVYHDVVYRVGRSDNEERSAIRMRDRLGPLGIGGATLERAFAHILATRTHGTTADPDTALLLDADLSVLGSDPVTYEGYAQAVRKEYRRHPDVLYRPGRRKVLQHFLAMPRIYRTQPFHDQFEAAARRNLLSELDALR